MPDGHGALALVGGGEWREGATFDKRLLDASGTSEVLVLPTAAAYEYPDRAISWASDYFAKLSVKVIPLMVLAHSDAQDAQNAAIISQARFIYLGGGSPLHLRSVLKDTLCWDAIVSAWNGGATVAGSSAGAMVLTDPMVDPRGGAYTLGLGLVRNMAFVPHYSGWSHDRRKRTLELSGRSVVIVGADERTALIRWPNGKWESDGVGEVVAYHQGEPIGLDGLEAFVELA